MLAGAGFASSTPRRVASMPWAQAQISPVRPAVARLEHGHRRLITVQHPVPEDLA